MHTHNVTNIINVALWLHNMALMADDQANYYKEHNIIAPAIISTTKLLSTGTNYKG